MNYNPYYFTPYMTGIPARQGLFSSLFSGIRGINWSGILGGTQKVLNIANQAIPVIKQVNPIVNNAKTMFKVMNEFRKSDAAPKTNETANNRSTEVKNNDKTDNVDEVIKDFNSNGPTFFV